MGTSTTAAITVSIYEAATLGAITVVTRGAAGLDFASAGGGTCTAGTAYAANSSCTVNVVFKPRYPGMRYGAVLLADSKGNRMATVYVSGSGQGSGLRFLPGIPTTILSNSQIFPAHLAVDGNGGVYFVDTPFVSESLTKVTPTATGSTQSVVGSGLPSPNGIAVDGAGDIYIADSYEFRVVKETLSGGSYLQSVVINIPAATWPSEPYGIAVDGSGNLYLTDVSNKRVLKETLKNGAYTQSVVPTSGLNAAYGIAVDGSGNLFIADTFNNRVIKETLSAGGYTQSTVAADLSEPWGLAVDGSGVLYIADSLNSRVLLIPPSAASTAPSTVGNGLTYPYGVAVDGSGNLYIADAGNHRILKENFSIAPDLSFETTKEGWTSDDSPQTITVWNQGDMAMKFLSVTYPVDFPQSPSAVDDCTSSTSLATGQACNLTVEFSPVSPVGTSASVLLNEDISLVTNAASAAQQVPVTGTETAPSPVAATPVFSVTAGIYPTAQMVAISDATKGATIYYTTNGATPTTASTKYSGAIGVVASETIQAIAVATGSTNSAVAEASYTIAPPAATPVFSPAAGTYVGTQMVTLSDTTKGATIYYTTNGEAPTTASAKYSGAISVAVNETIQAIAVATGSTNSAVALATYSITVPLTASPAAGTYSKAQTVTLSDGASGGAIYYTTNGATPSTASTRYTGPINVTGTETIRAIAVVPGCTTGGVSATYTIK
jgi:hypothetical protein